MCVFCCNVSNKVSKNKTHERVTTALKAIVNITATQVKMTLFSKNMVLTDTDRRRSTPDNQPCLCINVLDQKLSR